MWCGTYHMTTTRAVFGTPVAFELLQKYNINSYRYNIEIYYHQQVPTDPLHLSLAYLQCSTILEMFLKRLWENLVPRFTNDFLDQAVRKTVTLIINSVPTVWYASSELLPTEGWFHHWWVSLSHLNLRSSSLSCPCKIAHPYSFYHFNKTLYVSSEFDMPSA